MAHNPQLRQSEFLLKISHIRKIVSQKEFLFSVLDAITRDLEHYTSLPLDYSRDLVESALDQIANKSNALEIRERFSTVLINGSSKFHAACLDGSSIFSRLIPLAQQHKSSKIPMSLLLQLLEVLVERCLSPQASCISDVAKIAATQEAMLQKYSETVSNDYPIDSALSFLCAVYQKFPSLVKNTFSKWSSLLEQIFLKSCLSKAIDFPREITSLWSIVSAANEQNSEVLVKKVLATISFLLRDRLFQFFQLNYEIPSFEDTSFEIKNFAENSTLSGCDSLIFLIGRLFQLLDKIFLFGTAKLNATRVLSLFLSILLIRPDDLIASTTASKEVSSYLRSDGFFSTLKSPVVSCFVSLLDCLDGSFSLRPFKLPILDACLVCLKQLPHQLESFIQIFSLLEIDPIVANLSPKVKNLTILFFNQLIGSSLDFALLEPFIRFSYLHPMIWTKIFKELSLKAEQISPTQEQFIACLLLASPNLCQISVIIPLLQKILILPNQNSLLPLVINSIITPKRNPLLAIRSSHSINLNCDLDKTDNPEPNSYGNVEDSTIDDDSVPSINFTD